MLPDLLAILVVAALAQLFGGYITGVSMARFRRHIKKLTYAEAALMLAVSAELTFFAVQTSNFAILPVAIGIATIFITNRLAPRKRGAELGYLITVVFVAMCMHELSEGISFGSSFLLNANAGLLTAALIALHNIPEGSIVMMPYAIRNRVRSGMLIIAAAQVVFVVAGLLSYVLLVQLSATEQALSATFAAGAMIFIAVEEIYIVRKSNPR